MPPRKRIVRLDELRDDSVDRLEAAEPVEEQNQQRDHSEATAPAIGENPPQGTPLPPITLENLQAMMAAAIQTAIQDVLAAQAPRAGSSQQQPAPQEPVVPEVPNEESVVRRGKSKVDDDSTDEEEYALDEKTKRIALLNKEAAKAQLPVFKGTEPYDDAKRWINLMQDYVNDMRLTEKGKLKVTTRHLQSKTSEWWINLKEITSRSKMTWNFFLTEFHRKFYPQHALDDAHRRWDQLTQGSLTPEEYHSKFMDLARFFPRLMEDTQYLSRKFLHGFNPELQKLINDTGTSTVDELLRSAIDKNRAIEFEKEQKKKEGQMEPKRKGASNWNTSPSFQRRRFDGPFSKSSVTRPEARYSSHRAERRNSRSPGSQETSFARPVQCYNCYQFGHYKSQCPQPLRTRSESIHTEPPTRTTVASTARSVAPPIPKPSSEANRLQTRIFALRTPETGEGSKATPGNSKFRGRNFLSGGEL